MIKNIGVNNFTLLIIIHKTVNVRKEYSYFVILKLKKNRAIFYLEYKESIPVGFL